jgi:16S rRNA (uracil1498-N3)-methyltransferase
MEYSFFYEPILPQGTEPFPLREETARHLITVLRKRKGDRLWMTDGKGQRCLVEISETDKKNTLVRKISVAATDDRSSGDTASAPARPELTLAVSLLKNPTRFEWLLEKVTEIGVGRIVPLICARTEKTSFKRERLQNILISAMLQSQQVWLPEMPAPVKFADFVGEEFVGQSYIAHCLPGEKKLFQPPSPGEKTRILIGPEGDFTPDEINHTLTRGFQPVSLGKTRLRTETAGMVAVAISSLTHSLIDSLAD